MKQFLTLYISFCIIIHSIKFKHNLRGFFTLYSHICDISRKYHLHTRTEICLKICSGNLTTLIRSIHIKEVSVLRSIRHFVRAIIQGLTCPPNIIIRTSKRFSRNTRNISSFIKSIISMKWGMSNTYRITSSIIAYQITIYEAIGTSIPS